MRRVTSPCWRKPNGAWRLCSSRSPTVRRWSSSGSPHPCSRLRRVIWWQRYRQPLAARQQSSFTGNPSSAALDLPFNQFSGVSATKREFSIQSGSFLLDEFCAMPFKAFGFWLRTVRRNRLPDSGELNTKIQPMSGACVSLPRVDIFVGLQCH